MFNSREYFISKKCNIPDYSIPGYLALQAVTLPNGQKGISTNAVSRGCYQLTTVSITLGRERILLRLDFRRHVLLCFSSLSLAGDTEQKMSLEV
jgi:hypothetical protein